VSIISKHFLTFFFKNFTQKSRQIFGKKTSLRKLNAAKFPQIKHYFAFTNTFFLSNAFTKTFLCGTIIKHLDD